MFKMFLCSHNSLKWIMIIQNVIEIRCVRARKHLKHLCQWAPRTRVEDHWIYRKVLVVTAYLIVLPHALISWTISLCRNPSTVALFTLAIVSPDHTNKHVNMELADQTACIDVPCSPRASPCYWCASPPHKGSLISPCVKHTLQTLCGHGTGHNKLLYPF